MEEVVLDSLEKRLDKAVCNHLWLDSYQSLAVSTLIKQNSDHFPLLIDFKTTNTTFASQFRFMKMWSLHPDCKKLIEDFWNIQVTGSPMFVLSHKLKVLKERLKRWNRDIFVNVYVLVKETEEKLKSLQDNIDVNCHTDLLLEQQKRAQIEYQKALDIEEAFWQEKSRINWHLEGDRNTSYYHRITKIKQTTKLITSLRDGDHIINDLELIALHTTNHFQNIFCSSSVLQVNSLVEECIPKLISDQSNTILTNLPSDAEIHNAVFSLNRDGAPRPDEFRDYFYQYYWDIIKKDMVKAV